MEKGPCRKSTSCTTTRQSCWWPAPPQSVLTSLQGNINSPRNYWMPPAHPKRHHQYTVSQQAQEYSCWPIAPWTAPSQPPIWRPLKLYFILFFLNEEHFRHFRRKTPGRSRIRWRNCKSALTLAHLGVLWEVPQSVADGNDHPASQLPDWKKGILLWEAHIYHQGDDGKVTDYTSSAGGLVDCGFPSTPHPSVDCWGNTWLSMDEARWMFKLAAFAQNGAEQDHSSLIDQSKLCIPEHKPLTPFCSATWKRLCAHPPGDGKMFCHYTVPPSGPPEKSNFLCCGGGCNIGLMPLPLSHNVQQWLHPTCP